MAKLLSSNMPMSPPHTSRDSSAGKRAATPGQAGVMSASDSEVKSLRAKRTLPAQPAGGVRME